MGVRSVKELIVYQKAYALAMRVFEVSKRFPAEERYGLTSQIRRSTRSVPLNLREVWAKRRYEAHFVSKLTDCVAENNETDTALDFAKDCHYISVELHQELVSQNDEVAKMLTSMTQHPHKFLLKPPNP